MTDTIIVSPGKYRAGTATMRFRWAVPPGALMRTHTSTAHARLQQAHEYKEYDSSGRAITCGEEWIDVPTVIVPDLKPIS